MLRRAAVIAAGLALAGSLGLAGAGAASAAAPALKIHNGATWTVEVNDGGCEQGVFASNGTFSTPYDPLFRGDAGKWSGGGGTIKMKWTAGSDRGLTFQGSFTKTPAKEYVGQYGGIDAGATGQLVKGAVAGC